jgi:hypothetical protein
MLTRMLNLPLNTIYPLIFKLNTKTVNAELEKEKVGDVTLDCDNLSLSDEKRMGLNGEQLDQLKEDVEGKSVETKSVQVETKENPTKEKAMD